MNQQEKKNPTNRPTETPDTEFKVDFILIKLTLIKEGKDKFQNISKEMENIRSN